MHQRSFGWLVMPLVALTGCQSVGLSPLLPRLVLAAPDRDGALALLASKGNSTWQDAGLTHAPLLARRRATEYRLKSTALAGPQWACAFGAPTTSAPAFRRSSLRYSGPEPATADEVYVATEAAPGGRQIFKVGASDGVVRNGTGWDVLAGLKSPGTFQRTAVGLSADNKRLYLLTSGGFFIVVDADTGERKFVQKLSASGFAGLAPFIDYSNGGGYPRSGSNENVFAVSADGSVYRVNAKDGVYTPTAWPSAGGQDEALWPGRPPIDYGGPTQVGAFPIVWGGQAFFGTLDGRAVRVDLTTDTPSVTTWWPGAETSANNRAITAPAAVAFNDDFAISDVFLPCGDRLAWIDVDAPIAEEAVYVSPPLAVTKTTPVQGRLDAYPYDAPAKKGPYDCLDFASIATNASPAPSRWGNGSGIDGRVFGADGYTSPTDGNNIRGYLQFEVPLGAYGGAVPVGGQIELSAANNPATEEDLALYRASNFMPGTNTYWTGMNFSPDIDYANRPALLSDAIGGYKGPVSASSSSTGLPRYALRFGDLLPVDQATVSGFAWHSFAIVSRGKQRVAPPSAPESSEAARWHRGVIGTNATEPKLFVTLDTAALTPLENGMRCQAAVDEWTKQVWVMGSNAVFELSYASPTAFRSRANVTYSLTAAGRGLDGAPGPSATGSPRRFVFPKGNLLFTGSRLVVADGDPGKNRFFVNDFSTPLTPGAESLDYHYAAPAGSGQVGEQMLFDYRAGSAYMVGRDATLRRVDIR